MVLFYKHSEGESPEVIDLDLKLNTPVRFSEDITGTEEVVIVKNIDDAKEVNKQHPTARILISTRNEWEISPRSAVRLQEAGITDIYIKEDPIQSVESIREHLAKKKDLAFSIRQEAAIDVVREDGLLQVPGLTNNVIIGQSAAIKEVLHQLAVLKDLDVDIFLNGEPGVGKTQLVEILAANRKDKDAYLRVNVNEFSEELLVSELSGYKKGAFTGADRDKAGILTEHNKSLIFFDEIGDLSKSNQTKLLSLIQERTYRPVGDSKSTLRFNGRFAFATNQDMQKLVDNGSMRQDFLSRLRRFTINVPALRERPEDIPLLIYNYLKQVNQTYGTKKEITLSAVDLMQKLTWRDNIRQLNNLIAPMVLLDKEQVISPATVTKFIKQLNDPALIDDRSVLSVKPHVAHDTNKSAGINDELQEAFSMEKDKAHITVNGKREQVGIYLYPDIKFGSGLGLDFVFDVKEVNKTYRYEINNVTNIKFVESPYSDIVSITSSLHKKVHNIHLEDIVKGYAQTSKRVDQEEGFLRKTFMSREETLTPKIPKVEKGVPLN
jgi:DNA-binding NtrC family response regulator